MSDAMTNREIEDVLISIRRLVSQDGVRAAPSRPSVERLVLTPAQRIDEAESDAAADGKIAAPIPDAPGLEAAPSLAGSRVPEAAPSEPAPARAHVAYRPEPGAIVADDVALAATVEGAATVPQSGPGAVEPAPTSEVSAPKARAAEVTLPEVSAPEPTAPGAPAADGPAADAGKSPHASMPPPDFSQLEATIAELEAAVSASGATWEPDGSEGVGGADTGMSNVTALYAKAGFVHRPGGASLPGHDAVASPAEGASARPVDAPVAPVQTPPPAARSDRADDLDRAHTDLDDTDLDEADPYRGAGSDDAVIDEEMLRNLVAQMVREELHGQLGERITLQVRKLVRSEIARVLDERKLI